MYVLDEQEMEPDYSFAGFGIRAVAYLIDAGILALVRLFVSMLFGVSFLSTGNNIIWFGSLFGLLYFILLESGARRGTIGKQLLGLQVTDESGHRISLGQSVIRNLMKIVSSLILGVGFLMVILDERKRSLHDRAARTYVVSVR